MIGKHLEAEIYCPSCKHTYGRVFRVEVREGFYEHKCEPATIIPYCGICEIPTERRPA